MGRPITRNYELQKAERRFKPGHQIDMRMTRLRQPVVTAEVTTAPK
jgi:hypothetical protein